jgi:hypothetical protein
MRNSAGLLPLAVAAALEQAERDCDLDFIVAEMPRAIDQSLDGSRRVAEIVRAMKEFSHPDSADKTAANLNRAIESIAKDVGMAAKILQLANSAFIGSRGQVSSLIQAVSLIGTETVRTLVYPSMFFRAATIPRSQPSCLHLGITASPWEPWRSALPHREVAPKRQSKKVSPRDCCTMSAK